MIMMKGIVSTVPSLYIAAAAADQQFQQLLHYSHENTIIHVTWHEKTGLMYTQNTPIHIIINISVIV